MVFSLLLCFIRKTYVGPQKNSPNISRRKSNVTIKFGQLTESNKRSIFLQKSCINEAVRLVPDLFLFFKEALYELKASGNLVLM